MDELEDNLNMEELHRHFTTLRRQEHEQRMFAAAMKGVEMKPFDDPDMADVKSAEEVKENAMRRRAEFLGIKPEDDAENEFGYESE